MGRAARFRGVNRPRAESRFSLDTSGDAWSAIGNASPNAGRSTTSRGESDGDGGRSSPPGRRHCARHCACATADRRPRGAAVVVRNVDTAAAHETAVRCCAVPTGHNGTDAAEAGAPLSAAPVGWCPRCECAPHARTHARTHLCGATRTSGGGGTRPSVLRGARAHTHAPPRTHSHTSNGNACRIRGAARTEKTAANDTSLPFTSPTGFAVRDRPLALPTSRENADIVPVHDGPVAGARATRRPREPISETVNGVIDGKW